MLDRVLTHKGASVSPETERECVEVDEAGLSSAVAFPSSGRCSLSAGSLASAIFTMHTMLSYFLDNVSANGESSRNFKAVAATDSKSMRLFQRGFVQKIEIVAGDDVVFYRARCEPEMRSGSPHKMKLAVATQPTVMEILLLAVFCTHNAFPALQVKHPMGAASTWLRYSTHLRSFPG